MIIFDRSAIIAGNPSFESPIKVRGSKTYLSDGPRRWVGEKGQLSLSLFIYFLLWKTGASRTRPASLMENSINFFFFFLNRPLEIIFFASSPSHLLGPSERYVLDPRTLIGDSKRGFPAMIAERSKMIIFDHFAFKSECQVPCKI